MNSYETERLLSEYLLLHYGAPADILPYDFGPREALDFPARCAAECMDFARPGAGGPLCALDVGCAAGRAAFELARSCERVVGIDFSHRFIEAARALQREGALPFDRIDEGALTTRCVAEVPAGIDRGRVLFETGDAMDMPENLGAFDIVLAANLICRLPDPARFLGAAPRLVKPGGRLLLTSPYTWMDEFTPREKWVGGFERQGKRVTTLDALQSVLEPHFTLFRRRDLPFLIREHARKFQWSVAEATLWIRNGRS